MAAKPETWQPLGAVADRVTRRANALEEELGRAMCGKDAETIRATFRSRGLSFPNEMACGGLGAARARTHDDGTWTPNANAAPVAILPVFDGEVPSIYNPVVEPVLCDLIAWRPAAPGQWWLRCSDAPAFLGIAMAERCAFWQEPLRLYATPEAWLLAGGAGAVVLNWQRARRILADVPEIIAETIALGEAVDRNLREPVTALPRISIPREAVPG